VVVYRVRTRKCRGDRKELVKKGKGKTVPLLSVVPTGLDSFCFDYPVLKRWAKVGSPLWGSYRYRLAEIASRSLHASGVGYR